MLLLLLSFGCWIVTGFHGRFGDYLYAIGVNRTLLEVAVDQSSRKVEAGGGINNREQRPEFIKVDAAENGRS